MRIQHCTSCRSYQHYPRPICVTCGDGRPDEVEAAGTGTVDSFTVVHRAGEPFVLARVRLTEGPIVLTHLTGVADPRCDQPVRLVEGSDPPVFTGSDVIGSDVTGDDVIGSDVIGSAFTESDFTGSAFTGSDDGL